MNFTREPITETIITPKEGNKLVVRNTKGGNSEYTVDAIEVVNFGTALFFRSLERPKSFLLPVSDFEVVESKETRVAIKSAQIEKTVKISGGKPPANTDEVKSEEQIDKKKRRSRRRRVSEERAAMPEKVKGGDTTDEAKPASSPRQSSLFAPPTALISEQIGEKYKSYRTTQADLPKEVIKESSAPGHQEEAPIDHTPLEDFSSDEVMPDAEVFETTTEVESTPDVQLPTSNPHDQS
ncbi:MAG: hypothetical protein KDK44_02940 [Chlamydiia bacterium]|nr:hypothetical protein [Chlamydiia bacterium]